MVPSSFGTTRFLSKPNVWHNHPIAAGASRYRRTGMTVALVFFAILGTTISFCLCDVQRLRWAAAERRSREGTRQPRWRAVRSNAPLGGIDKTRLMSEVIRLLAMRSSLHE